MKRDAWLTFTEEDFLLPGDTNPFRREDAKRAATAAQEKFNKWFTPEQEASTPEKQEAFKLAYIKLAESLYETK